MSTDFFDYILNRIMYNIVFIFLYKKTILQRQRDVKDAPHMGVSRGGGGGSVPYP